MTKYILQAAGIPQVPYVPVLKNAWKENPKKISINVKAVCFIQWFVKPANMGSSVGISKAENREELQNALQEAYRYDTRAIVEQGIEAREIEVAVLGNEDVRTTMPGEIVKDVAFYDYNSKYIDNRIEMQIPAQIPEETQAKAQEFAKKAYTMLGGSGLSRCDFFLTNKNELFLNELNTMPGFTEFSMYPLLWEKTGLPYGDLIDRIDPIRDESFQSKTFVLDQCRSNRKRSRKRKRSRINSRKKASSTQGKYLKRSCAFFFRKKERT